MARIRSLKPEAFQSETLAEVSVHAERTFQGMSTHADDRGRLADKPAVINGAIWPMRRDHTVDDLESELVELRKVGLICRYVGCDGKRYLHLVTWDVHQRIERPSKSRQPRCPDHPVGAEGFVEYCGRHPGDHARCGEPSPSPHRNDGEGAVSPPLGGGEPSPSGPRTLDLGPRTLDLGPRTLDLGTKTADPTDAIASLPASGANKPRRRSSSTADDDPDFDAFWSAYPLKAARPAAAKAWAKARAKVDDPQTLIAAAARYREQPGRESRFTAHPATWLNDERWTDQPAEQDSRASPSNGSYQGPYRNRTDTAAYHLEAL